MKKYVYILGAGASKDFYMPLGNEYYSRAEELLNQCPNGPTSRSIISDSLKSLENNLSKIYPNFIPNNKSKWPLLEEILTISFNLRFFDVYEAARDLAVNVLIMCHGDYNLGLYDDFTEKSPNFIERKDKLKEYLRKNLNKGKEVSFISFNYDNIIDSILLDLKINFSYGIPFYDISDKKNLVCTKGIRLLKPHGSLNLAFCLKCKKIYYDVDILYSAIKNNREYAICCNQSLTPLYVPALFSKIQLENREKEEKFLAKYAENIYNQIVGEIAQADKIIIIGYSFPSYDFEFKIKFLDGVCKNKKKIDWEVVAKGQYGDQLKGILPDDCKPFEQGFFEYIKSPIIKH